MESSTPLTSPPMTTTIAMAMSRERAARNVRRRLRPRFRTAILKTFMTTPVLLKSKSFCRLQARGPACGDSRRHQGDDHPEEEADQHGSRIPFAAEDAGDRQGSQAVSIDGHADAPRDQQKIQQSPEKYSEEGAREPHCEALQGEQPFD